jgi:hypothetical protein
MLSIYEITVYESGIVPTIVPKTCHRCDSECVENYRHFALTPRCRTQRFFSESNIAASCWRIDDCWPELGWHIRSEAGREATNRVPHRGQWVPSERNGFLNRCTAHQRLSLNAVVRFPSVRTETRLCSRGYGQRHSPGIAIPRQTYAEDRGRFNKCRVPGSPLIVTLLRRAIISQN